MLRLNSQVVRAVLSFMFLHEDEAFYLNELVRRIAVDKRNLAKKLQELKRMGLIKSHSVGNQRHFSLNRHFPLYQEYRQIVLKTVGLEQQLRDILSNIEGIQSAVIFGSYAENKLDTASDIDILVVGSHDTIHLQEILTELQRAVDREINVISMGRSEYQERASSGEALLEEILAGPLVEII